MITFVRLQKRTLLLCSLMFGLPVLLAAQWGKPPMPKDTFHSYNICFPADIEIRDCAPPPPPSIIKDELGECDMLAVHIKENVYRISGDDCYKIFRTYSVINWCAFKEACGSQNQQVFVVDRDAPVFDGVLGTGVCLLVRDNDKDKYPEVYYSKDLVADPGEQIAFSKTCLPNAHPVWQYTQIIKVYDEIAPVVTATAPTAPFATAPGNCRASVRINFQASDNCTGPITLVSVQLAAGIGGTMKDPAAFIPGWTRPTQVRSLGNNRYEARLDSLGEGTYELGVLFRDDCGNLSPQKRIPFEVRDTTAPVPICHHGLSASLMANGPGEGMVILRAMDFVASPVYDCNGQGPQVSPFNPRQTLVREYSLNLPGQTPKPDQDSLVFDCSAAGDSVLVELHAWDRRMNHAYCLTYVKIQDNEKLCAQPGGVTLAGFVRTEMGIPMPGVEIRLQGAGIQRSAMSGADGAYAFDGLEPGVEYTMTPVYNGDIMQGLESRDLLALQDHLLGMKPLASPYQRIAADINRSAYISIADMITLQRLILGRYTDYSAFRSWRFVREDYAFPDPDDPWMEGFPEVIHIPSLSAEDKSEYNFVAIKTGDLNYSAMAPEGGAAALRSGGTSRALMLEDRLLQPGARLELPLTLAGTANEVAALSAHLFIDPALLRVREIIPGILSEDQIHLHEDDRTLSIAGILPNGDGKRSGVLLTLIVEAEQAGLLSDAIRQELRAGIQAANLRDGRDELLLLTFSQTGTEPGKAGGLRFAPNPFQESGELAIQVSQAGALTLTLLDVQGRVLHTAQMFSEEGELRWTIPGRLLPAQGVYFARLESSWGVETIKIVKGSLR